MNDRVPEEAEADLARLATLVAHEMRTPLSVVSGYMKMLAGERQGPLTEAQRRSVAGADRACQQLIALAADMSWLGRIGRGEVSPNPTPVALGALLAELAAAHTPIDEHPVYVEAPADAAGPAIGSAGITIEADAGNLRRVLTSMLAAVVRGAPDEATVRLLARRRDGGAQAASVPDGTVAIALAPVALIDDLLAADPRTLDALDESTGGLGVGLPLAQRLLALEGGTVGMRGTPQGLGILVTLPG